MNRNNQQVRGGPVRRGTGRYCAMHLRDHGHGGNARGMVHARCQRLQQPRGTGIRPEQGDTGTFPVADIVNDNPSVLP